MKKFRIALVSGLIFFFFVLWYYWQHPLITKVVLGGKRFQVEVAITDAEKQKGLGYRDRLADEAGMLFIYSRPEQYSFWMMGMQFPLDIIWINGKTIVDIASNVPVASPGSMLTYSPKAPADKVLEVNAGTVERLGVKIGDLIQILKR